MLGRIYSWPGLVLAGLIFIVSDVLEHPTIGWDYMRIFGVAMTALSMIFIAITANDIRQFGFFPMKALWVLGGMELLLVNNLGHIIERFHEPFLWWSTPLAVLGAFVINVYVFSTYGHHRVTRDLPRL